MITHQKDNAVLIVELQKKSRDLYPLYHAVLIEKVRYFHNADFCD